MSNAKDMDRLLDAAAGIPTVDTHQHLWPEVPVDTDLCRVFLDDNCLLADLVSAGLSVEARRRLADPAIPLRERWALVAPFWERVRFGSYAQAYWITLRDLYGAVTLDGSEIEEVCARLAGDFATPGLYRRILGERCHIDAVLTQGGYFPHTAPRFFTVASFLGLFDFAPGATFDKSARAAGVEVKTGDDVAGAMDAILRRHHALGAKGFKTVALPWKEPSSAEVKTAFRKCHRERRRSSDVNAIGADDPAFPLACLCVSRIAARAREFDLPVAMHTGVPWTSWMDFRVWEPTALIPLLSAFRDTRFDLYHAGIPYGTQASMLGKAFPNVWHNLTWACLVSEELAGRSLNEWLDMIPMNKIIGFGGDYNNRSVVMTYGHLIIARRNIAQALVGRMRRGEMNEQQAVAVMRAWFSDNPRALYRLPPPA